MSEFPLLNPESQQELAIRQLLRDYFPSHAHDVELLLERDQLHFIVGGLLDQGKDPGVILAEYGIKVKDNGGMAEEEQ